MAKPRGITLQQKFGFQDKDLTTPKHDEIMLWLDRQVETNLEALLNPPNIREQYSEEIRRLHKGIRECRRSCEEAIADGKVENGYTHQKYTDIIATLDSWATPPFEEAERLVSKIGFRLEDKIWEKPITAKRSNFITGFVDMYIEVSRWYLRLVGVPGDSTSLYKSNSSFTVVAAGSRSSSGWETYDKELRDIYPVYFEVKTTIRSLGETIRQIRMYQEHAPEASSKNFIIVCPDDRFAEQLRSQNIAFVKYAPEDEED